MSENRSAASHGEGWVQTVQQLHTWVAGQCPDGALRLQSDTRDYNHCRTSSKRQGSGCMYTKLLEKRLNSLHLVQAFMPEIGDELAKAVNQPPLQALLRSISVANVFKRPCTWTLILNVVKPSLNGDQYQKVAIPGSIN